MSGHILGHEHGKRKPFVIDRKDFGTPSYPDAALDEMRVKLPEGFRAPDPRNPFLVVMERADVWLQQADDKGHKLTPEKMVKLAQYTTGKIFNDQDIINMRGLARDTINPPYDRLEETKGALSRDINGGRK